MSFAIVTDSLAGLPLAQIAQRGLVVIPLSYTCLLYTSDAADD